jgi:hypothetical protein
MRNVDVGSHLEQLLSEARDLLALAERTCAVCGRSIARKRRDAITCGNRCRMRRLRGFALTLATESVADSKAPESAGDHLDPF